MQSNNVRAMVIMLDEIVITSSTASSANAALTVATASTYRLTLSRRSEPKCHTALPPAVFAWLLGGRNVPYADADRDEESSSGRNTISSNTVRANVTVERDCGLPCTAS